MKIYQTYDIEESIRTMTERNESCIVFQHSFTRTSIRERLNLVSDIPSVLVRPWDSFAAKTIKKWQKEKGLMYYRHLAKIDLLPECDAFLFTCCPLNEKELNQFSDRVKKEIIIYRPPDWSMHDETMNFKFPMGEVYKRIMSALMVLKKNPLTRNQKFAAEYWGFPENFVIGFNEMIIEKLSGLKKGQFSKIMNKKFFMLGHHHRFDIYQPMIDPDEPDLLEMYRLLESETNVANGLRFLRFGRLRRGYVKYFEKALKILVKQKCVMQYDSVHLILEGFKEMDYEIQDAISTVRIDQCLKFRKMVEDAPDYFAAVDTQPQLQSESILCEEPILDKDDSTPKESVVDRN